MTDEVTGQIDVASLDWNNFHLADWLDSSELSFDAIVVDAKESNDKVTVTDSVRKTVWIDAGVAQ
ncbi:MAG: hypothetical protein U1D30_13900 [Planctomycetota bacterium]